MTGLNYLSVFAHLFNDFLIFCHDILTISLHCRRFVLTPKIMKAHMSSQKSSTLKVVLIVVAIYAAIALITYLVW